MSVASFATSSRWVHVRLRSWTHSSLARSRIRTAVTSSTVSSAGIAGYGNSVGVPTVGGQITFDATLSRQSARQRLLPRTCCRVERLVLGRASGVGNLAVLLGSRTGRDGIGGVSVLASAGFGDATSSGGGRQATERAGRRSVRGEAAHRGLPRAARRRSRRRHPGSRRRRARAARPARRPRAAGSGWTSTSPPCPAASRG